MLQVNENLYIGNTAEFGEAATLESAGIQVAVATGGWHGFPHSEIVMPLAVLIYPDMPSWGLRGLAVLLADVYAVRVMSVHDRAGGYTEATFLLACTYAQKLGRSFDQGLEWMRGLIETETARVQISPGLQLLGQETWP